MSTLSKFIIGMADAQVVQGKGLYECPDIGSGIGLVAVDRENGLVGFAHFLFPTFSCGPTAVKHDRFVDTGVADLLESMKEKGCSIEHLNVAYAGGAKVLRFSKPNMEGADVGARNCTAVEAALSTHGIVPKAVDTGGTGGRTLSIDLGSGTVKVRTFLNGERVLLDLSKDSGEVAA